MESKLDERSILAHFDRLVDQGLVVYNGNYRTVTMSDKGFDFEFRVLTTLTHKPQAPADSKTQSTPAEQQQPGCRPGSDINVSGYELTTIGPTHLLAANKFPAARPHLLLLTQDGFRRQYEALNLDDLSAARHVLSALTTTRPLLLFNCGIASGCSRMHKHMQIFPAPPPEQFRLWPDSEDPHVQASLPFKAFVHRFPDGGGGGLPSAEAILGIYQALVRRAERALGWAALDGEPAVPHNVVMDRRWLVVVPRRAAGWEGADTNAAGMLGIVWVHSEERMGVWVEKGPAEVLRQLGVPAELD